MLVVFICSIGMIITLSTTLIIKCLLIAIVTLYTAWLTWRFILLGSLASLIGIKSIESDQWLIHTPYQNNQAILCGDSVVTAWIMILRFKIPGKFCGCSCVLFRDSLSSKAYRRLLVKLRMGD